MVDPAYSNAPLCRHLRFRKVKDVESWKATFHNPSTSPASYTKTLLVARPWAATAADVEEGGWVKTFSCVVHLEIDLRKADANPDQFVNCLVPFHGFSPAIKSPRLDYIPLPLPPILDLIHSFPLLEDLSVPDGIRREVEIDDGLDRQLNTPHLGSACVYRIPGALWGEFACHSLVVPTKRSPLPKSAPDIEQRS